MSVTQADLSNFFSFATAKLNSQAVESMHDLLELWILQDPDKVKQEQASTLAAINEGLADIEAGRVHDFDQLNDQIRNQHGWSSSQ